MNNIYYCYIESRRNNIDLFKHDGFEEMSQPEARDFVENELNEARCVLKQYATRGRDLKSGIGFNLGQRKITKAREMMRLYCDHFRTSYFHKPNPNYGVWVDYEYQPSLTPEEVGKLLEHHQVHSIDPTFWAEQEASGVTDSELMLEIRKSLHAHQRLVKQGLVEAGTLFNSTDLSIYSELMKMKEVV